MRDGIVNGEDTQIRRTEGDIEKHESFIKMIRPKPYGQGWETDSTELDCFGLGKVRLRDALAGDSIARKLVPKVSSKSYRTKLFSVLPDFMTRDNGQEFYFGDLILVKGFLSGGLFFYLRKKRKKKKTNKQTKPTKTNLKQQKKPPQNK